MSKEFESKLRRTQFNCSVNVLLEVAGRVLIAAGVAAVGAVLVERLLAMTVLNDWTVGGLTAVSGLVVFALWLVRQPNRMQVALLVDERLKLNERFSTTLAMQHSPDPFARAACNESRRAAKGLNVSKHFPVQPSKCWFYVLGVWALAFGLMMWMPQKDLLGFLAKKDAEEKKAVEVEKTETAVKTNTTSVKQVVERLKSGAGLDEHLAKLEKPAEGATPQEIKRDAIRKLGDLADNIKKMQTDAEMESTKLMEQMLKQLKSMPDALSQEFLRNLAKGDFAKASDIMEQLREKLMKGEMSDAEKDALSKQLEDIAKQLQDMAEQNKELEKELEKQGLNKDLAKLDINQLREALQKKGIPADKLAELLKKAKACQSAGNKCSALSKALSQCAGGAGAIDSDDMAAVMDELAQLDSFKEQAILSEAAIAEIDRAIAALGEGMCEGVGMQGAFRPGSSNRFGAGTGGPGRGYGVRGSDDRGNTSTTTTRVKGKTEEGPVVASWYVKGAQIKGESKKEFTEVVQASRDSAAEAISENEIPRKYEESVKTYFGRLEEASEESSEE